MLRIGGTFTELASVDSTNNYAMALAHEGLATHGNVFFAHEQTAGKGQRGRQWKTTPRQNIMLSVVVQPLGLSVSQQFPLSASIALGCYDFFKKYAIDDVSIKWPNDIYWRDRKAGGILIENIINGGKWHFAIVGIGININQTAFVEGIINPVSLKQITGKKFDTIDMAKELCQHLEKRYEILRAGDFLSIIADYNDVLYKKNEKIRLRKDNAVFETTILYVSNQGTLITEDTMQREFNWGEVNFVL